MRESDFSMLIEELFASMKTVRTEVLLCKDGKTSIVVTIGLPNKTDKKNTDQPTNQPIFEKEKQQFTRKKKIR